MDESENPAKVVKAKKPKAPKPETEEDEVKSLHECKIKPAHSSICFHLQEMPIHNLIAVPKAPPKAVIIGQKPDKTKK